MQAYHRVVAEIDLDAIGFNIRQIKSRLKKETRLMAVVKADAYGHGAVEASKVCLYNGADCLAVATCDEGVELRQSSIQVPIIILGNTVETQLETVISNRLTQTVFCCDTARAISDAAVRLGKKAIVHIKIDTGMGRIGFSPCEKSLDEIDSIFNMPNIEVTGIFTHFASADESNKDFTLEQYKKFRFMTDSLEKRGHKGLIRHCANSAAILDMPELQLDMTRAGIIVYGMYPSSQVSTELELKPAMKLKSQISYVKEVEANTSIGYGRTYFTDKKTKVATVPVGYADGYSRKCSNKARVIVGGQYAPVIGNVCMDQLMLDVTHIDNVKIGDSVTIMGKEGELCVSAEELAEIQGTINYEIVCNVGKRVPRVFIRNGEIINTKKTV